MFKCLKKVFFVFIFFLIFSLLKLYICSVWMDDWMDDGIPIAFVARIGIDVKDNVKPMHNAQVCYFKNVWFMFLVF